MGEVSSSTPKSEMPCAGVGAGGGILMDFVGVKVAASARSAEVLAASSRRTFFQTVDHFDILPSVR